MADEDLKTEGSEEDEESNRKLVAIMFTDIKDFSKKMGKDEKAAMEILKKHDAMMRVFVAKHGGKVIKSIGDSFMVDFSSAVNAVKCSIKAQEYFHKHNTDKSDFDKIEIRIGIHLGDVVLVGNDMYGDGVNIASRIEAITEPNRICITADVYNQVKKKMDLKVYHIGSMELKNIEEPVEVYEVLLDSIPEFALPSETAKKAPSKRKVEAVTKEEADEAREIEVKKQKAAGTEQISEAEKMKLIQEHYRRAEEFYEKGEIEKAEEEINEIYRLDPNREDVSKKLEQEEQKQQTAEEHFKKAEEFFNQGKYDEAEKAANEIFKIAPLHARGQALLGHIEDKRYELKEQQRREEDAKRRSQEGQREKAEGGVRRAKQLMDQYKYREALAEVEHVLSADPESVAGKELKGILDEKLQKDNEELAAAEKNKQAEEQAKTLEQRREGAQKGRQLAEEQANAASAAAAAEEAERRRRRAAIIKAVVKNGTRAAAVVGIAAVLYYGIPMAYKAVFPNKAFIAVTAFSGNGDDYLAGILPTLIAQDLLGHDHVTVVAPTTSSRYDTKVQDIAKIAGEMSARQIMTGEVRRSGDNYSLIVRMFDGLTKEQILEEKYDKDIASLPAVRSAIVRTVLEKLEIDATPRAVTSPTSNAQAFDAFLYASWLIDQADLDSVNRGVAILGQVTEADPTFSLAYSTLAHGIIRQFRQGGEGNRSILADAIEAAKKAIESDKLNAAAYLQLGMASRYIQRFEDAKRYTNRSLSLQPANPGAQRELALLSVVEGDYDKALGYLSNARPLDPKNPDTFLVAGLIHHFKQEYSDAVTAYQAAIALGGHEFVITTRYLSKAWDATVNEAKTAAYYEKLIERNQKDYAAYYRIGQAYQSNGKIDNAKKFLEPGEKLAREAIDANTRDPRPHIYRALFLTRLGDPTGDWEKEVNTATDLASNEAEVFFRKANVYAIQKKKTQALAALKRALELDYTFAEILNVDFSQISREPEFQATIVRPIKQADLDQ